MVGGVTEYKLVQECRRESCAQAGYKTQAGALEVRAQSWKAASIGPEGDRLIFHPRVVNVPEGATNLVTKVVIDPDQLLPPVLGLGGAGNKL